jgi:hypothetical protein
MTSAVAVAQNLLVSEMNPNKASAFLLLATSILSFVAVAITIRRRERVWNFNIACICFTLGTSTGLAVIACFILYLNTTELPWSLLWIGVGFVAVLAILIMHENGCPKCGRLATARTLDREQMGRDVVPTPKTRITGSASFPEGKGDFQRRDDQAVTLFIHYRDHKFCSICKHRWNRDWTRKEVPDG